MIRLYAQHETELNHNRSVLTDISSAIVSETLNDQFEINLSASREYADILIPESVVVVPTQRGEQPFRIKEVTKTLGGLQAWGQHLFYDAADVWLEDSRPTNANGQQAITHILQGTQYTGVSDIDTIGTAYYVRRTLLDALLGADNALVNVWGGQLIRDGYQIRLRQEGLDRGYTIRLGRNLVGVDLTLDHSQIVTRVVPTGVIETTAVTLPEVYLTHEFSGQYPNLRTRELRVELPESVSEPEEAYSILRERGWAYLEQSSQPILSAEIDFVELSKTEDYKDITILEQLDIGDKVRCDVPTHEIDLTATVVAYQYDCLAERYVQVTLGSVKPTTQSNIARVKQEITDEIPEHVRSTLVTQISYISDEIAERIKDPEDGHIRVQRHADGRIFEILAMDTEDVNTARDVIRINYQGIGLSNNGINGPYAIAMTAQDGLYADYIHGLKVTAAMIESGVINTNHISTDGIDAKKITVSSGTTLSDKLTETDALQSELTQAVQVGGRNLFKFSDYSFHANPPAFGNYTSAVIKIEPSTTYTISYTVTETNRFGVWQDSLDNGIYERMVDPVMLKNFYATIMGDHIIETITTTSAGGYIVIYLANNGADKRELLKVEKGTIPTTYSRAPEDIEADIAAAKQEALEAVDDLRISTENMIDGVQAQVDGKISTWYETGVPTASNPPANGWTTNDVRAKHVGDLYHDRTTGQAYRYTQTGTTFSWEHIKDSDITKALQDASKAQDTADGKRRVFVETPYPPYDVGDLWVQGESGELMRCQTERLSGSYRAADWVKAVKYTDDTQTAAAVERIAVLEDGALLLSEEITDVDGNVSAVSYRMEVTEGKLVSKLESEEFTRAKQNLEDAIAGKANAEDFALLEEGWVEQVNDIGSWGQDFNQLEQRVENGESFITQTKRVLRWDEDWLWIGLENSAKRVQITNEKLAIQDGGHDTAYFEGQNMYISNAHITENLHAGNHVQSSYAGSGSRKITVIRGAN